MIVVPMLNPDGTFLGNYRTCSLGTDLNRMWIRPGAQTEPTLKEMKDLIRLYAPCPLLELAHPAPFSWVFVFNLIIVGTQV